MAIRPNPDKLVTETEMKSSLKQGTLFQVDFSKGNYKELVSGTNLTVNGSCPSVRTDKGWNFTNGTGSDNLLNNNYLSMTHDKTFTSFTMICSSNIFNATTSVYHPMFSITNASGVRNDLYLLSGLVRVVANGQRWHSSINQRDGTDKHYIVTWDGTTVKCYVNNSEITIVLNTTLGTSTANSIWVGRARDNVSSMPVRMPDKVVFLDRVITSDERAEYYADFLKDRSCKGNTNGFIRSKPRFGTYNPVTRGLKHHYPLDERTGTTAFDISSGKDGTNNGATINQSGINGRSYSFDGLDDYISTSYAPDLENFTVSVWAYYDGVSLTDSRRLISWLNSGATPGGGFHIAINPVNNLLSSALYNTDSNFTSENYDTFLVSGTWYHIVTTVSRSGNTYTMKNYLNGVLKKTKIDTLTGTWNSGRNLRIGAPANSTTFGIWKGGVDDVKIYDRVLDINEIKTLYEEKDNLAKDLTNCEHWYDLELNNYAVMDKSGNGRHLTKLEKGVQPNVCDMSFSTAGVFQDTSFGTWPFTGHFTLAGRMRIDDITGTAGVIYGSGGFSADIRVLFAYTSSSGGNATVRLQGGDGTGTLGATTAVNVPLKKEFDYVITNNKVGTANNITVYIDGVNRLEQTITGNYTSSGNYFTYLNITGVAGLSATWSGTSAQHLAFSETKDETWARDYHNSWIKPSLVENFERNTADNEIRFPQGWTDAYGSVSNHKVVQNSSGKHILVTDNTANIFQHSKQLYGEWRIKFNKADNGAILYYDFIADSPNYVNFVTMVINPNRSIALEKHGGSLFQTAAGYIQFDTNYEISIIRDSTKTWQVFIKGGVYTDWTLISKTGGTGSNPIQDTTVYECNIVDVWGGNGDIVDKILFYNDYWVE